MTDDEPKSEFTIAYTDSGWIVEDSSPDLEIFIDYIQDLEPMTDRLTIQVTGRPMEWVEEPDDEDDRYVEEGTTEDGNLKFTLRDGPPDDEPETDDDTESDSEADATEESTTNEEGYDTEGKMTFSMSGGPETA